MAEKAINLLGWGFLVGFLGLETERGVLKKIVLFCVRDRKCALKKFRFFKKKYFLGFYILKWIVFI